MCWDSAETEIIKGRICYQTLGFPDPKYFSPASGASATRSRSLVLQDDLGRVLDLNLLSALHAICLSHSLLPPFNIVIVL